MMFLLILQINWDQSAITFLCGTQMILHLLFLRLMKKNCSQEKLFTAVAHHSSVESLITYCITIWHAGCSAADKTHYSGASTQHKKKKSLAALFPPWMTFQTPTTSPELSIIIKDRSHTGHSFVH